MTFFIALILVAAIAAAVSYFWELSVRQVLPGAIAVCWVCLVVSCIAYAPTGTVKVVSLFGKIQPGYLPDTGLQIISPFVDTTDVKVTRQESDGGQEVRTGTMNDNFLTVDAVMPYSVNRDTAWKLLSHIPDYKGMLAQQATSALRQGISGHRWQEAVNDGDQKVATAIGMAWQSAVKLQLKQAGFSEVEADSAFTFYPVRLKKALPDEPVQQAAANRSAQEENLATQLTLTLIANEIKNRRTPEGEGLANLIKGAMGLKAEDPMPKLTSHEVAELLNAISTQERAQAMQKWADDSKRAVTLIVNGDTAAAPVAVGAQHGAK